MVKADFELTLDASGDRMFPNRLSALQKLADDRSEYFQSTIRVKGSEYLKGISLKQSK